MTGRILTQLSRIGADFSSFLMQSYKEETMRTYRKRTRGALLTGLILLAGSLLAGSIATAQDKVGADDPGYKKCVRCHDEESEHPVLSILMTKHGVVADSRTPMANDSCTSCHGPSQAHIDDDSLPPDITFEEKDASIGIAQCQTCATTASS